MHLGKMHLMSRVIIGNLMEVYIFVYFEPINSLQGKQYQCAGDGFTTGALSSR